MNYRSFADFDSLESRTEFRRWTARLHANIQDAYASFDARVAEASEARELGTDGPTFPSAEGLLQGLELAKKDPEGFVRMSLAVRYAASWTIREMIEDHWRSTHT